MSDHKQEDESAFCKECGHQKKPKEKECSSGDHDRYRSYGDNNCRDCGKKL